MAEKITTSSLLKRIFKTRNLSRFMQQNEQHMRPLDFCGCLKQLCDARQLVPERVIMQSQIERTYGHQIFNGTRRPSREKVLQLAFGLRLTVEETQRLLRAADRSQLYPRLRRDAALIFCLQNGLTLLETQELLGKNGLTLLGDIKRDEG